MQNYRVLISYCMLSLAGLYVYHQLDTPSRHITLEDGDYIVFFFYSIYPDAKQNFLSSSFTLHIQHIL